MRAKLIVLVVAILAATGCGGGDAAPRTLLEQAQRKCSSVDFTGAYEGESQPNQYGTEVVPILVIRPSNTVSRVGGTTEAVRLAEAHYSKSTGWMIFCLTSR